MERVDLWVRLSKLTAKLSQAKIPKDLVVSTLFYKTVFPDSDYNGNFRTMIFHQRSNQTHDSSSAKPQDHNRQRRH
jgi:hypothetical protein